MALVTGGSGFIGRALIPVLQARGFRVVAASRRPRANALGVVWRTCDLLDPDSLPKAFEGARVAYYLVHSMGSGGASATGAQPAVGPRARARGRLSLDQITRSSG